MDFMADKLGKLIALDQLSREPTDSERSDPWHRFMLYRKAVRYGYEELFDTWAKKNYPSSTEK